MNRVLTMALIAGLSMGLGTATVASPPVDEHAGISPDDPNPPLPKYATAEEERLPLGGPSRGDYTNRTPPTGLVYCPPEYEPCEGMFIAWEAYTTSVLRDLAVGVTTNDPDAVVWVVVDTSSEQSSAYNSLNSAGADMDQVQFIVRTTNSVWIRDYGPRFIYEDGLRAIIDHHYNRPTRPNDNALNDYISPLWGIDQYDIPLTHGGGNFHLFSNRDAFMSDLILDENPALSEQDVIDLYADYQNLDLTIYPRFPSYVDSTGHIDMWMMPLADDKIVISQWTTEPARTITENAVTDLTARGYEIHRVPGWNSGGTHYTYTNAVIFNNLLFISYFGGGYASQDAQALAVYQAAMPDYQIIQVYSGSIIQSAGAMHCVMMHVPLAVPDPIPSVTVQSPNGGELWFVDEARDITWTANDDVAVTAIDISYSTDGGLTYPHIIATGEPDDGILSWTVPNTVSDQCRVKVVAHDADSNTGQDLSDADFSIAIAPIPLYQFPLDVDPGWTTEGQWAFGQPVGGGSHNRDPGSGFTGDNVYGYNRFGDYPNNMPLQHLTAGPLDCSAATDVELRFQRWLGVENASYDHANIEVSSDGNSWTTVWEHNGGTISDSAWNLVAYDVSAVADDQPTVYLRWGMGTTDGGVTYPGWNIDDVELWAVIIEVPGDCNCDGTLDLEDIPAFTLALTDPAQYAGQYPGCDPLRADTDGSDTANGQDIPSFVQLLVGP